MLRYMHNERRRDKKEGRRRFGHASVARDDEGAPGTRPPGDSRGQRERSESPHRSADGAGRRGGGQSIRRSQDGHGFGGEWALENRARDAHSAAQEARHFRRRFSSTTASEVSHVGTSASATRP